MTREEEIIQAALDYANNQSDIPIKDEFSKNLCIALGQAFMAGANWADATMLQHAFEGKAKELMSAIKKCRGEEK